MPEDKIVTDRKILEAKSEETSQEEIEGLDLVARLQAAMKKAWVGGHGLAAIQIGIPIRAGVYQTPGGIWVTLLNPVMLEKNDLRPKRQEGCLSIPNRWFPTNRYEQVKVENGPADARYVIDATGVEAWILQHEIDHLDGVLCDSRCDRQSRNELCVCLSGKKFKKCCGR